MIRKRTVTLPKRLLRLRIGLGLMLGAVIACVTATIGCPDLSALIPTVDLRSAEDIDGDGIVNEMDEDMDGDGLLNNVDPDADSDGRLDHPVIVDFPFDHNAFIEPLLPPNHPKFDYQGRLVIPAGHIDITDIIRVNLETHPLEFFEPARQEEISTQAPP